MADKPTWSQGGGDVARAAPATPAPAPQRRSQTYMLKLVLHGLGLYHGPLDDTFDDGLSNALRQYQQKNGLTVTGLDDFATQGHLNGTVGSFLGAKTNNLPPDVYQKALALYGPGLMAYLNNSELGPIIQKAALGTDGKGGGAPSADTLRAELQNTDYWRTTAANARNFDVQLSTDPASAQQALNTAENIVKDRAATLGLTLSAVDASQLGYSYARLGWDAPTLNDMLMGLVHNQVNPRGEQGGELGSTQAQVKAMAAQYLLPISDQSALQWAMKVERGEASLNGSGGTQAGSVEQYMRMQAQSRYPWLAKQMDQGVTPGAYFQPMKEQVANTLEISPNDVDLINSPVWSKLTGMHDTGTGEIRPMTMTEAMTYARSQPQYWNTSNGRQTAAQTATTVLQKFGAL